MTSDHAAHHRIVVGVDGSEPSKHALRWARFMAGPMNATVHAVCAWEPPMYWAGAGLTAPPPEWDPAADAQKILDDTITEVFGGQSGTLSTSVVEGGAARVLLDAGEQADLMVVGSRGHGGFTGLLLGSVSSACAEHATCPVLVVHGETPPPPA